MFESITQSLTESLGNLMRGKLTESNIKEGMSKVRQALLEADVNYDVAKLFCDRVTEQAVGERVLKAMRPGEMIVGIVYQELVNLMGGGEEPRTIELRRGETTVLMMCGLQGSGKTTTCGKLAKMLKAEGAKPMLVAADLQRPAAIEQLKVIGEQIGVPVYAEDPGKSNPVQVCVNGRKKANTEGCNVLILDTAGRLHVDDDLMRELEQIDNQLMPHMALLVCDAMTGQDAVNSAKAFNDRLELDGVILTKLDGDTRGGAALSVKSVTGVPILFTGLGEQLDALQPFYPDRMAQRILGQGDLATLAETMASRLDQEEMQRQQERMMSGKFTLDDFLKAMEQIKKLGSMRSIMKLIPGMGQMAAAMDELGDMDPDKDLGRIRAMIQSMTLDERRNPDRIDRSRRNRIAQGSGTDPAEVHGLLKQFGDMAGMMKGMAGLSTGDRLKAVQQLSQMEMNNPGAKFAKEKQRSKRGPQDRDKLRDKKRDERKRAKDARKKNKKRK
ncbi:MAG: signal recognition particle protein [Planctomycetaceae bacterium]|nr:signal recognition particle protein [Planctomycetaceae bacterium]